MFRLIHFLLMFAATSVRTRLHLQLEIAALQHQLSLYKRREQRPRITAANRILWCLLAKLWSCWRAALHFVQPRTTLVWQSRRFRDYWRRLSRPNPGRPRISPKLRSLIRHMWTAQQLVEAFPIDTAPSYVIQDDDGIFGWGVTRRIESLGMEEIVSAPASPWQQRLCRTCNWYVAP